MSTSQWRELLTDLSRAIVEGNFAVNLPEEEEHAPSEWLGYPPATEAQIAAAEARLGCRFPPSYQSFLQVSNGWRDAGPFISRLWSTEEVDRFAVRNQDWIDAWTDPQFVGPAHLRQVPDEQYFVYGSEQDTVAIRTEYLPTMLEVSDVGDSAIILLNPQVVTREGEWEAWLFANWIPGAYRYRSFWELMQGQYEHVLHMLREQRGEPTPYADPSLGVAATDVDGLVAALGRADWRDRFHAIEALGNLRERRAVEPLLAIFQDTDENLTLRERAAVALGRIRDERARAPLIDALRVNPVSMGDLKVASLLGNLASLSCGPGTIEALSDLTVRDFLAQMPQALGGMIPPAVLEQMIASLTPERVGAGIGDHLGYAVGQALIAFGAGALPALTVVLADPDPQFRRRIGEIIDHIRASS